MVEHVPFTEIEVTDDIVDRTASVVRSGRYVDGPQLDAFEAEFADAFDVDHAVGVSSGTAALSLSLRAAGVGEGDTVLLPAHTFFATASAAMNLDAEPVFVDVDPETYAIDVDDLEAKASFASRPAAVVPVHIYGQPADMDGVRRVADEYGLTVIEDSCQAHAARYDGEYAGTIGDLGCFSFYPSKNMTVGGDGGMIVTDDAELADAARRLRNQGRNPAGVHVDLGLNYRLDEFKAAFGREHLTHVEDWGRMRRENAALYDDRLAEVPEIETPTVADEREHVYHLYVVQADERDALRSFLSDRGVETGIHYEHALHQHPAIVDAAKETPRLPVVERLVDRIVSLPMHPWLTESEVEHVCTAIEDFYRGERP
ncbi:DegT/DnrJ/EryC1/StrS family aminotransferase [Haloarchaeobius salinus]|uniref:DegT/DnrJ/EryC1/StrS family aminotransferase n=1 Tax=Haloarchaeobius salinus TaxID=1198298 RepID=UPI002109AA28|nr:DegT/DnrJ/EryC1/StrS family aminotransferase [Haloarchaeobius salinus]